jgi:glutamyl-tRNA reductase
MTVIAIGINHNTAPVALREKVAFTPDAMTDAFASLQTVEPVASSVVLSTCNRTELYIQLNDTVESNDFLVHWLADFHQCDYDELAKHIYIHQDVAALNHIMRVASGLDSLILGEPQILGQVKQAVSDAKRHDALNTQFQRIFDHTFQVAKKVRTDTDIGANAVSVAFAAVQLAKQIFGDLARSRVLLIGAGETIDLVAKHLHEQGAVNIDVANRTISKAQEIATRFGGQAMTLNQLPTHLPLADIVISSTASQLPLIGKGMVEQALEKRKHKPMLMIDIAVPRDIEGEVAKLDEIYLYTVDDLQHIVAQNMANREQAAEQAQTMIDAQILLVTQWQQAQENVDMVKMYREAQALMRDKLISKALSQLQEGMAAEHVLQEFGYKLTNQMMHGPTKALAQAAQLQDNRTLELLTDALNVNLDKS